MNYKNANKCHKCPQCNGENGCPWWWEVLQTDIATGEERIIKDCGKVLLPMYLTEVIKASNRPAAEIGAMRQGVVDKLQELAQSAMQLAGSTNTSKSLGDSSEEN